jgi:hypothetical protein
MKYTVEWIPPAEDELTALWTTAPDQAMVTAVVQRLEQLLSLDPYRVGESRQSSVSRVVLAPPVGLSFDIIEDDKKVLVLSVWPMQ